MSDEADRINALERLPRRRGPERDLWPGIEARLAPRRSRYPMVQLALAASLVGGLAAVFALSLGGRPGTETGAAAVALAPRPLTYDSRAIVEANLTMVLHAERELQQALAQDPDSASLRALLASTQDRQRALRALI